MSVSSTQELPNRVDSGASNLVRGSSTSSDTNDPVFLDHDGEHYVYFSGVSGNNASQTVSWAETTLFEYVFDVTLMDLTPSSAGRIASDNGVVLELGTSGNLIARYRATDAAYNNFGTGITATALGFSGDGDRRQVRIVFDTDAGTATYYAREPGSDLLTDTDWGTAVGTLSNAAFIGEARDAESTSMGLGGQTANFNLNCLLYRFAIVDTDNAVTDFDFNPSVDIDTTSDPDAGQSSFTTSTGETTTINRSATGLATAVVTRPVILFDGTDDYLQLPTSDTPSFTKAAGEFTAVVVLRKQTTATAAERVISWESAADDGCDINLNTSDQVLARAGDGTAVDAQRWRPDVRSDHGGGPGGG